MGVPAPLKVDIGGRKVAYDEAAPAHPRGNVLLLGGLGGTRLTWRGQLRAFGGAYRTLAPDHRDSGESDPADADYATAEQADDAAAFLRSVGAVPTHVLGLSMGGFVALHLALRHPDLVRSLVLVGTSAGGARHVRPDPEGLEALRPDFSLSHRERALRSARLMMRPGFLDESPAVAQAIAASAEYFPPTPESYARQFRSTRTHDVTGELARLRVPTLVVHGTADPVIKFVNGEHLAGAIPGAELLAYPGVGHLPQLEHAPTFNRDVLAFLDRHA